jgi:hypothetical protein
MSARVCRGIERFRSVNSLLLAQVFFCAMKFDGNGKGFFLELFGCFKVVSEIEMMKDFFGFLKFIFEFILKIF